MLIRSQLIKEVPMKAPIPEARQTLTAYLIVRNAAKAIEFYAQAFGAKEAFRLTEPQGKIGHAELRIGDSMLMLADEYPDFGALSPAAIGGSPVSIHLYVEDVDRVVETAVAAGATILRAVKNEFFGDRAGMLVDPFGHRWHVATHEEDVSPQEMQRRWEAMFEGEGGG
jgi:PhnB protein